MAKYTTKQLNDILDYKYRFKSAGANSIREYFHSLLYSLYDDGECFSGKRPFGYSCWESDIFQVYVEMGVIKGKISRDEDGYLEEFTCDEKKAWELTFELIAHVFFGNND